MKKRSIRILFLSILLSVGCGLSDSPSKKEINRLTRDLKSKDPVVRSNAAFALGGKKNEAKNAVPFLAKALKDKDRNVRMNAVLALGLIGKGAANAIPTLVELLKDPNPDVREYSAYAVGRIKKGAVVRPQGVGFAPHPVCGFLYMWAG